MSARSVSYTHLNAEKAGWYVKYGGAYDILKNTGIRPRRDGSAKHQLCAEDVERAGICQKYNL